MALAAPKQEFYALRIYQLRTADQEVRIDSYLQTALLPALHRIDQREALLALCDHGGERSRSDIWQVAHPSSELGAATRRNTELSYVGVGDFLEPLSRLLSATCVSLAAGHATASDA